MPLDLSQPSDSWKLRALSMTTSQHDHVDQLTFVTKLKRDSLFSGETVLSPPSLKCHSAMYGVRKVLLLVLQALIGNERKKNQKN